MSLKLVEKLDEAMAVRRLRNSCREHLTNFQGHIGMLQQVRWYVGYYRHAQRSGRYRLYMWRDDQDFPVGYGALSLQDGKLIVTECVATAHRGRGYGKSILGNLIRIAREENRDLVAEVWAANEVSVSLHEKVGFRLVSSFQRQGRELRTYVLRTNAGNGRVEPVPKTGQEATKSHIL